MVGRVDLAETEGSQYRNCLNRNVCRAPLDTVVDHTGVAGLREQSEEVRESSVVDGVLQMAFDEVGQRFGGTRPRFGGFEQSTENFRGTEYGVGLGVEGRLKL